MAGLVLDASVPAAALLPEEVDAAAAAALLGQVEQDGGIVPALWPTEIANALLTAVRRQRLAMARAQGGLAFLETLPIEVDAADQKRCWHVVMSLAHPHQLTVYDASYLELAVRRGVPLATLDQRLRAAAMAEGVPVLP